ncbi:hypothetical protein SACE_2320 [Saccharopolyspora erythraea NRRL 2338]|uniref:Uncharacterized protein n=3 Tax=Saccharopolyspora erythraea TaxID=1836 RepID=A4FC46_SACEN|nr:hypothetical protein SACE_2320 [Saccharopolyspora erythraea NRRL 2338]
MEVLMSWSALDQQILPDDTRWGQGFAGRAYTDSELAEFAQHVAETQQPGYGPRLHASAAGFERTEHGYSLPPGYDATGSPHRAGVNPARLDPDIPTAADGWQLPAAVQQHFRERAFALDQHGRPVHPHADQLLERIGMNTGIGWGWRLGENVVVDAVVLIGDGVLLWHTGDAGRWAVPGGYTIPADHGLTNADWNAGRRPVSVEGIQATARRKVAAETGIDLPQDCPGEIVRGIRPISSPHILRTNNSFQNNGRV